MGIQMVRQPSETPNIENTDDFIPIRYAYGNQDGYVIGKDEELEPSINGSTLRIGSGRVVLQGVESDIDANGVTFDMTVASEKRYYVVYYEVNLANMTTNVLLSNYSTTNYPTIDAGADLTNNIIGVAKMELCRFTTQNGVISDLQKTVKPILYYDNDLWIGSLRTPNDMSNLQINLNNQYKKVKVYFKNNGVEYNVTVEKEPSGSLEITDKTTTFETILYANGVILNRITVEFYSNYIQIKTFKQILNIDTNGNSNTTEGLSVTVERICEVVK